MPVSMSATSPWPILASFCLALAAGPALAGKPHEHGVARLDVAVEPARVTVELDTPLENVLGFERAPRTDAERERAQAVLKQLRAGESLFRLAGAAGCTLDKAEINAPVLEAAAAPTPATAASKEGHADLEGHYEFRCKDGSKAGFVEVGLFEAFPSLRRIEMQVVTPRGQLKASLVKPASRVQLVR